MLPKRSLPQATTTQGISSESVEEPFLFRNIDPLFCRASELECLGSGDRKRLRHRKRSGWERSSRSQRDCPGVEQRSGVPNGNGRPWFLHAAGVAGRALSVGCTGAGVSRLPAERGRARHQCCSHLERDPCRGQHQRDGERERRYAACRNDRDAVGRGDQRAADDGCSARWP